MGAAEDIDIGIENAKKTGHRKSTATAKGAGNDATTKGADAGTDVSARTDDADADATKRKVEREEPRVESERCNFPEVVITILHCHLHTRIGSGELYVLGI